MSKERKEKESEIIKNLYTYFDENEDISLADSCRTDNYKDFLNIVQKSMVYIFNMNAYASKCFKYNFNDKTMFIKILKKKDLPDVWESKVEVEENGKIKIKTKKQIFYENINNLKVYDDMVFQPKSILNKKKDTENILNIYTGPPSYISKNIENFEKNNYKINDEKIKPIINHIKILTNNNINYFNYLINWMANIIQHPDKKNGVCIVIKSDQGAGKSSIMNWFGRMVVGKQWFLSINDARLLVESRFNSEMQNKLFTVIDEAQTNGRYVVGNEKMKTVITEDWLRIEMKGKEAYTIEDKNNYVLLTNNDFPVKIDYSDRRYFCFNSSNELVNNGDYFKEYFKILEDKEVAEQFYYYLLNIDLKNFNCNNIPETHLKTEIRIDSSPTPIKYAIDLVQNGYKKYYSDNIDSEFMRAIETEDDRNHIDSQKLYTNYKQFCSNKCTNDKIYTYSGFNKKIKELLNIKTEKTKTLGDITFVNKEILIKNLCTYFNVNNISEILCQELIYDEGYNSV